MVIGLDVFYHKEKLTFLGAATCFDLNSKQENLIIVGTEDGKILEYSKMHRNKLLTTFEAHHMPIYAIKWNTYNKKIFLSCSADWTVKIWDHRYRLVKYRLNS